MERFAPYRFTILHNPQINFYFQKWVFDQEEEVQRREAMAKRQATATAAPARLFTLTELSHKAEDAMLIRLLHRGEERRPRVLDYGMGSGEWPQMAKAYGSEVWGTDVDPRSTQAATESGIHFAKIEEMPGAYFDFINADQVFEHLPDPLATIKALASKLARGGHLKFSTPSDARIEDKIARLQSGGYTLDTFKKDFHALSPLSHINLFAAEAMRTLARAAGLEPFQVPLKTCYSVATGFHSLRQLKRNFYNPLKRHRSRGTWQFFVKP